MEGAAEIIGIEAGDDDALAHIGETNDEIDDAFAEELRFIDADDFRAPVEILLEFLPVLHPFGLDLQFAVADDVVVRVALVDAGLEYLHALACDLSAAKATDQFFALAAEHGPTHHFDPTDTS